VQALACTLSNGWFPTTKVFTLMRPKKFCPYCASPLVIASIEGRERRHCEGCGTTVYENPVPASCVILIDRCDRVLLTKRNVEPRAGYWCLPGGFIELGESPEQAALRELREETCLLGKIEMLLGAAIDPHPDYHTVLITCYLVRTYEGEPVAGDDVSDAAFYRAQDLPEIAFSSHRHFIRNYFSTF
jgi:8-oxo-dGTP diphosphatase